MSAPLAVEQQPSCRSIAFALTDLQVVSPSAILRAASLKLFVLRPRQLGLLRAPKRGGWAVDTSYADFLEDVLRAERDARHVRSREILTRMAGLPALKTLAKALRSARRRQLVDTLRRTWKVSVRRACSAIRAGGSSYHYKSRRRDQADLKVRIKAIAETRVRYGYRRNHILLLREGWRVTLRFWKSDCGSRR